MQYVSLQNLPSNLNSTEKDWIHQSSGMEATDKWRSTSDHTWHGGVVSRLPTFSPRNVPGRGGGNARGRVVPTLLLLPHGRHQQPVAVSLSGRGLNLNRCWRQYAAEKRQKIGMEILTY